MASVARDVGTVTGTALDTAGIATTATATATAIVTAAIATAAVAIAIRRL